MRKRKVIHITLYRKSLLYDISNCAYIIADSMPDIDGKVRSAITDICEEGNVDRVTRIMNTCFNELVNKLYAFTKDRVLDECVLDDLFVMPVEYNVYLSVPEDFSKTTIASINDYLHEYIVDSVLADWFCFTKKDEAPLWAEKADICVEKMRNIMSDRVGAVRRKMSPF